MENSSGTSVISRFSGHLFRYILIYETISLVIVLTGLFLLWREDSGKALVVFGLLAPMVANLLVVFSPLPDPISKNIDRLLFRINAWMVALLLAGMIFFLYHLPFAETLLAAGTVAVLLLVLAMLIRKTRIPEQKVIRYHVIIKSLIAGIAGVVFYMLSVNLL